MAYVHSPCLDGSLARHLAREAGVCERFLPFDYRAAASPFNKADYAGKRVLLIDICPSRSGSRRWSRAPRACSCWTTTRRPRRSAAPCARASPPRASSATSTSPRPSPPPPSSGTSSAPTPPPPHRQRRCALSSAQTTRPQCARSRTRRSSPQRVAARRVRRGLRWRHRRVAVRMREAVFGSNADVPVRAAHRERERHRQLPRADDGRRVRPLRPRRAPRRAPLVEPRHGRLREAVRARPRAARPLGRPRAALGRLGRHRLLQQVPEPHRPKPSSTTSTPAIRSRSANTRSGTPAIPGSWTGCLVGRLARAHPDARLQPGAK